MDRRQFLSFTALSAAATAAITTGSELFSTNPTMAEAAAFTSAWPKGCITTLPKSKTRRLAWTVDDGSGSTTLGAYLKLLEKHEYLKMTFFVLSCASGWKTHSKRIRALIENGQVQMANHTYTHVNLISASNKSVARQLKYCDNFIKDTYEIDPGGFWRPPYGALDRRVLKIAKDNGFDMPMLWDGSTGSSFISKSSTVWKNSQRYMTNGRIVLDHANGRSTVDNFDQIMRMLKYRKIETVTLAEAFNYRYTRLGSSLLLKGNNLPPVAGIESVKP